MRNIAQFIALFFCLSAFYINAQTVEVIAEKRVQLKPVDFVYFIPVSNPFSDLEMAMEDLEDLEEMDEEEDEEGEEEEPEVGISQEEDSKMEDLMMTLEQQKFKAERSAGEQSIYGEIEAIRVFLTNETDLEKLQKLLETFDISNGFVEEAHFEDKSVHFEVVYPELLEKAKKEAAILAKLSGKTLGAVLAIQEVQEQSDPFDSLMRNYMNNFRKTGLMRDMGFDPMVQEVEFRFMFRFALN